MAANAPGGMNPSPYMGIESRKIEADGGAICRENCATYGNGTFVAGGSSGTIIHSAEGVTWTNAETGTTLWLFGLTYEKGLFIACGEAGTIRTSTDGATWTNNAVMSMRPGSCNLHSVTYGAGRFVIVGASGLIMVSEDGLTWSNVVSGAHSGQIGHRFRDKSATYRSVATLDVFFV